MSEEPTREPGARTPEAGGGVAWVSPFADTGCIYLLVAGVVLGVLLGPAVFGRVLPDVYEKLFVGGVEQARQIEAAQAEQADQLQRLEDTGVTEVAVQEQALVLGQQMAVLRAQLEQARRDRLDVLVGWSFALMLSVVALMMIEALISPQPQAEAVTAVSPMLGRLVGARYALTALWIALGLAQPALLSKVPVLLTGLLVVVCLLASWVPLGKRV